MTGATEIEVTLPRGIPVNGTFDTRAGLRTFTGRDEEFLLDGGTLLPAERNTAILARCVTKLGPRTEVTSDDIRDLCLGDRDVLLLHLCAAVAGRRLYGVIECPDPDCKERSDIDLDVDALLVPAYDDVQQTYEAAIGNNGDTLHVRFRLPTAGDQERAAHSFLSDPSRPQRYVADTIVEQISSESTAVKDLPDELVDEFSDILERLDPQGELRLSATCPECERTFSVLFDPGEFLIDEVASRRGAFYGEVHLLAFHYHWSEADILTLPIDKRRTYLGLIADELAEGAPA